MLNHLEKLLAADDVETIWALHCARMGEFGFDRLLYGFTPFRTAQSLGNLDDSLILSNHDDGYLSAFLGEDLYSEAPMVKWAAFSVGAQSWRIVAARADAGNLTAAERRVLALNQKYGVLAGYSIAFAETSSRAKGAIGLCARPGLSQAAVDDIWQAHGQELWVLNSVMHMKISALPFATARRPLTMRQREVLEWAGDGKTTADIAQIMGLTPATVEKHLRLAREALAVETTTQAVLKASMQKRLFVSAPLRGNDSSLG